MSRNKSKSKSVSKSKVRRYDVNEVTNTFDDCKNCQHDTKERTALRTSTYD